MSRQPAQSQLFSASTFHVLADDCSTVAAARAYAMGQAANESWPSGTKCIVHFRSAGGCGRPPTKGHFSLILGRDEAGHVWDQTRHQLCPICVPKPKPEQLLAHILDLAAEELFGPETEGEAPF